MLRGLTLVLFLLFSATAVLGDAREDCDKGRGEVAITGCTERIRQNPRNAIAYYNRGNAYREKKEYDRAIADYTKAIEINPKYAKAYNNRGATYQTKGDRDRAIADYRSALGIDPGHARARANLEKLGIKP